MIEFFAEYGLFLLKVATVVVAIVIVISVAAAAGRKATQEGLEVEHLNKKYKSIAGALRNAVQKKDERKKTAKEEKKRQKAEEKSAARPRCFVIDFKGDLKASAVPSLREEVSAVLDVATPDDKVIVRLENHGGIVHEPACTHPGSRYPVDCVCRQGRRKWWLPDGLCRLENLRCAVRNSGLDRCVGTDSEFPPLAG
jgi:hypothetical protein